MHLAVGAWPTVRTVGKEWMRQDNFAAPDSIGARARVPSASHCRARGPSRYPQAFINTRIQDLNIVVPVSNVLATDIYIYIYTDASFVPDCLARDAGGEGGVSWRYERGRVARRQRLQREKAMPGREEAGDGGATR
jgi:hypothetical protein